MAATMKTSDHEEIEDWIEAHDGTPAKEPGTSRLSIDFGNSGELEKLEWEEFFEILEREQLALVYEKENMVKDDGRPVRDKYDFVRATREEQTDLPDSELDNPEVRGNTEETLG